MSPSALQLLLLDSRSPAGAHHHSGGMEPAISAGLVRDLADVEAFCLGRLLTIGRVSASFTAAAWSLADGGAGSSDWLVLDQELTARTPSPALRTASRQLGSGLTRLLRSLLPAVEFDRLWQGIERPAPHHPLVLGAGCAFAGARRELAARAAALATCTSPAGAAVRLLGLDPYASHALLARLAPEIDLVAAEACTGGLAADGAPALELLADHHLTAEVRLFAS
jgi:urease accessory protein